MIAAGCGAVLIAASTRQQLEVTAQGQWRLCAGERIEMIRKPMLHKSELRHGEEFTQSRKSIK